MNYTTMPMNINAAIQRQLRRATLVASVLIFMLFASQAQAFLLQNLESERVDLLDSVNQGRWTLMMFWSTDCIPCEEQKPAFEAFHQKYKSSLASVVGVAIDGVEHRKEIDELIDRHQPTYPNFVAFSDVYHRQFEELTGKPFRTTPRYVLFDRQGQLHLDAFGYMDFAGLAEYISEH